MQIVRNFYTISYPDNFSEDGQGELEIFFGLGFPSSVTVNFTSSDGLLFNGEITNTLEFGVDELGATQAKKLTLTVPDDLIISSDYAVNFSISFQTTDASINGLSEDLTVSITDNDFQRSYAADQLKVPSDGNNKIIYDLHHSGI